MKHSSAHEDQNTHLAKESSNPIIRILWTVLGSFFVAIGGIGAIIPGLPTTLFLILAAACYIRSSQRLYDWLINNKTFGPYLRDYREGKGIPKRAKVLAVSMIIVFVFDGVTNKDNNHADSKHLCSFWNAFAFSIISQVRSKSFIID
jgi:uncharacterized membrane protein YbaN (DUF454 family)